LLYAVRYAFLPTAESGWASVVGGVVIAVIALAIRSSIRGLLFLTGSIAALLTLYVVVWFGGLRASGIILVVIVTAIWIAAEVPPTIFSRIAAIAFNITLIASAVSAVGMMKADIAFSFSGSKEMAAFIDHRFDNYEIAAHRFYETEALLPYLPGRRFWYAGLGEYGTYLKWDEPMGHGGYIPYETAIANAQHHFAETGRPWLLLLNKKMPQPERWGFRLIHTTSVVVFRNLGERYWLYEPIR
jgi:hypothetical protein